MNVGAVSHRRSDLGRSALVPDLGRFWFENLWSLVGTHRNIVSANNPIDFTHYRSSFKVSLWLKILKTLVRVLSAIISLAEYLSASTRDCYGCLRDNRGRLAFEPDDLSKRELLSNSGNKPILIVSSS